MDDITKKLQAILYIRGGEVQKGALEKTLDVERSVLEESIAKLTQCTRGHGLVVIQTESAVSMRTAPECQEIIINEQKVKERNDIGVAGLEVLSIVLYTNGASRSEIDYIRGVNSSTTIRQLAIRGLLAKVIQEENRQLVRYEVTPELLAHIGVSSVRELPNYEEKQNEIQKHLNRDLQHG